MAEAGIVQKTEIAVGPKRGPHIPRTPEPDLTLMPDCAVTLVRRTVRAIDTTMERIWRNE
jgi:hypothetical protein